MISLDRFGLSCVRGASLEETLGENSPQPACPQHQRPRCSLGIIGMFWTGRSCRRRQCWPWRKRKRAIGPASAPCATIRTPFARSSPYSLIICDFTGRIKFWPARRLYGTYFRYAGRAVRNTFKTFEAAPLPGNLSCTGPSIDSAWSWQQRVLGGGMGATGFAGCPRPADPQAPRQRR